MRGLGGEERNKSVWLLLREEDVRAAADDGR